MARGGDSGAGISSMAAGGDGTGGGLFNRGVSVAFANVTLADNNALGGVGNPAGASSGGGLRSTNGTITLASTAGEREGTFEGDGFVAANAFYLAQVREGGAGERIQGAEAMKELFGNGNGRNAFQTGAQDDGNQFGILRASAPCCTKRSRGRSASGKSLMRRPTFCSLMRLGSFIGSPV